MRQNEFFCPSFYFRRAVKQHLYAHTHSVRNGYYFARRTSFCLEKNPNHRIRFFLVIASPENIMITFPKGNIINCFCAGKAGLQWVIQKNTPQWISPDSTYEKCHTTNMNRENIIGKADWTNVKLEKMGEYYVSNNATHSSMGPQWVWTLIFSTWTSGSISPTALAGCHSP